MSVRPHHANARLPSLLLTCFSVAATLLCADPTATIAQDSGPASAAQNAAPANDWRTGYRGFRMLLEEQGLQADDDIEQVFRLPRQSVILVLGQLNQFPARDWLRLRRFVAQGGAVLVAGEESFRLPGVTSFNSGPAESVDPRELYLQHPDVLVLPCSPTSLTSEVSSIVVNRTGWMAPAEDQSLQWTVVAALSKATIPSEAVGQPVLMVGEESQNSRTATGVMVLSADGSLFTDGMLWHGENSILAINTAALLSRGQRSRFAVLEYGGIPQPAINPPPQMSPPPRPFNPPPFNPPPPNRLPRSRSQSQRSQAPPPPPPPRDLDTTLQTLNALLDKVQKTNLLNETLRDRPRSMPPGAWLRTVLMMIGTFAAIWLLLTLLKNRRNPLPEWKSRAMQSLFSVTSGRQIANSEFGPAAETLCREFCLQVTGSDYELDWLKLRSDTHKAPLVENLGRTQRTALNSIVSIATNGAPLQLSRKRFEQLGASIRQLWLQHRQQPLLPASITATAAD